MRNRKPHDGAVLVDKQWSGNDKKLSALRTAAACGMGFRMPQATVTAQLIARVRKFVARRGQIKYRLALRAGLSENALRDCDKPGWNPRAETLGKVIRALEEIEAEEASEEKEVAA